MIKMKKLVDWSIGKVKKFNEVRKALAFENKKAKAFYFIIVTRENFFMYDIAIMLDTPTSLK